MRYQLHEASALRRLSYVVVGALLVSACGGTAVGTAQPPSSGGAAQATAATQATATQAAAVQGSAAQSGGTVTGHLGETLSFKTYGGQDADGTLVKVFDPAVPVFADEAPPAGTHWVGVEVTLDNHSPDFAAETSSIDGVTSDGTTVTEVNQYQGQGLTMSGFQGCTETDGTEGTVQPFTHCQAFLLTDGQTLVKVGAKVGEVLTFPLENDLATWSIP